MITKQFFLLLTGIQLQSAAFSTETDAFYPRYNENLQDSIHQLDSTVNQVLKDVHATLQDVEGCNESALYRLINSKLGGTPESNFIKKIKEKKEISYWGDVLSNSVYKKIRFSDAPFLHLSELGVTFRAGSYLVGSDKFTNFFELGYQYFDKAYLSIDFNKNGDPLKEDRNLEKILSDGLRLEKGLMGGESTGIVSYADLAAAYRGLQFWLELTGMRSKTKMSPFFDCQNKKWYLNRVFSWGDYIDAGWDEAINCSTFGSKSIRKGILSFLLELEKSSKKKYTCPVEPAECAGLETKYLRQSRYVVSPECLPVSSTKSKKDGKWESVLGSWKKIREGGQ